MNVEKETQDGGVILAPDGRLDSRSSVIFKNEVQDAIDLRPKFLIVDCKNLSFMSSAGLRVFLFAAKSLKETNSQFAICSVGTLLLEVIKMSGFDEFILICPDRDHALAAIG